MVVAGGCETRYRRAGAGRPVLLVSAGSNDALFDLLASCFRVIAPRFGARPGDAAAPGLGGERLVGLLDGLGLERPGIVAVGPTALEALSFALHHPHRVARLALVAPDLEAAEGVLGPAPTADVALRSEGLPATGRIPLLVLGAGEASEAEVMTRFLRGDRDP